MLKYAERTNFDKAMAETFGWAAVVPRLLVGGIDTYLQWATGAYTLDAASNPLQTISDLVKGLEL